MSDKSERREFFRVDEELFVFYRRVEPTGSEPQNDTADHPASPVFDLCAALGTLSRQLNGALIPVRRKAPETARALDLLDKKLELVVQMCLMTSGVLEDSAVRSANLSANGVAFHCSERLQPEESIHLVLILPLSGVAVQTQARVERCELQPDFGQGYPYYAALQFTDLAESQRDLLVKYGLRRQRTQIRAKDV
jgi:hypothetical protein